VRRAGGEEGLGRERNCDALLPSCIGQLQYIVIVIGAKDDGLTWLDGCTDTSWRPVGVVARVDNEDPVSGWKMG
jgi:hypothetical protein